VQVFAARPVRWQSANEKKLATRILDLAVFLFGFSRFDGGRTRARTLDPLIKNSGLQRGRARRQFSYSSAVRAFYSNATNYHARTSLSSNDGNPRSRPLYQLAARNSVLVGRLWAGLVFDELALIAQPLGLGVLGVALVIVGSSPTKN
jgi:hypothetical protein